MRDSRPTDRVVKMACPRHGMRWVLQSFAAQWSCSAPVDWTEEGQWGLCGNRGRRVAEWA